MTTLPERTIGLDIGDHLSHVCVVDRFGDVVLRTAVATLKGAVESWLRSQEPSRVVLEVSTHSRWIGKLGMEAGHEVLLANPRRVKLIYGAVDKSDESDAEKLARLGRLDASLLRPVHRRSDAAREGLVHLRVRDTLVRERTRLVSSVRSISKSFAFRVPKCRTALFPAVAREKLPEEILAMVGPLLDTVETLTQQIERAEATLSELAQEVFPESELVRQIPGVGVVTSLAFVLTLDDPARFAHSRDVPAYLGLVPKRDQSGQMDRQLGISKAGDTPMRRLLVQSAQHILGPLGRDSTIRRWGLALAQRGGRRGYRRAVVAVARKLAVIMHRLWVTGEVYEPLRGAA
jgi:transposase